MSKTFKRDKPPPKIKRGGVHKVKKEKRQDVKVRLKRGDY